MRKFYSVGCALITAIVLAGCNKTSQDTSPKAATAPISQPQPARLTFNASAQDLIDRYNKVAADIDRSILLPPANVMEEAGKNPIFHVVRHSVKPNISVAIEIENASGRPFSLSTMGVAENQSDQIALLSTMAAIGAAVFGKGDQAGELVKTCVEMAKTKAPNAQKRIDDMEAYCAATDGIWMAGISVVDERSTALKTTK